MLPAPPSTALMLLSCLVLDGWASAAPKRTIDVTFTATTTNVMMAINCGKITFRHRKIIYGNQLDLINITIHADSRIDMGNMDKYLTVCVAPNGT
jgi:hypothetical protein